MVIALRVAVGGARAQPGQGEAAQSPRGEIQGIVTVSGQQADPSSLEGSRVELKESSQDSQLLTTLTDSTGHYEFTGLLEGTYSLRVIQQGFKPFAKTISLNADKNSVVDIALVLDTVVEKVEVKEQTASLPTESSSPASTINNAQLETLPLAQQKFRDALPIVPGAIRTIDEGRVSFSEVSEYDVRRDPVRGLAWPKNEIKSQGVNSFTRVQAVLSPQHVFNADVNVFPMRTEFANITALVPQTASSDYDQKGVSAGISDLHSFRSGALLRIALRYTRFESNAHGQGPADMLVNPEGWDGNFFSSWTRNANQFELYPTFQFAPKKWLGRHEFKIGLDITHRSYDGNSFSHPIQLLRQDGTLAEEVSFASNGPLGASATDVEEFVQDRWMVNELF